MLVVFVAVLAATVKMYSIVPKGFIPDQDNDSMNIQLRAAQGTSFYEMATATQRVAEIVRKNPYIDSFMATTGGGGNGFNNAMNTARLMVNLVPRRQRPVSAQQIAQELRPQLLRFPGFRAFVQLPSSLQIGGRVGSSSYNVTVQSANTEELYTQEVIEFDSVWGAQHSGVLQNFAANILDGTPLLAPGSDGINGVRLANAIHLSSWTGQEVSLDFDEDDYLAELNKRISEEGTFAQRG